MAFFNDTETSSGNTFSAGTIDLKIDYQCPGSGCGWGLKDLTYNDAFFRECDVKPGDSQSSDISWHVFDNNAWGRVKVLIGDYENGCTEPEEEVDQDCGNVGENQGELDDNLKFTFWMDEGQVPGWQCSQNQPHCPADPKEGNSTLDPGEPLIVSGISAKQISQLGWIVLPQEIIASNTYYLGVKWEVPSDVNNIIQTDSISGIITMEVVQSRNNPGKIFP